MSRWLNTAVMVDGVVYEAGTFEAAIEGEVLAEGVWDGEPDPQPVADEHANTSNVRELCEYIAELHVADRDVPVAELLKSAVEIFGDPEDGDVADAEIVEPKSYADVAFDDLKTDAANRELTFTGSGSNGNIVKADHEALVAALQADDAAKA